MTLFSARYPELFPFIPYIAILFITYRIIFYLTLRALCFTMPPFEQSLGERYHV